MIDESFHLTPLDVRRTEFPTSMRGYDKARVDEFRDRVADELERMTRLNQELDSKAKGFHEQLRAFRERDKALNEALVSAQQLRVDTKDQAEREASLSLREARAEGERLIESARSEARKLAGEIEALGRSRRAYLMQLRSLVAHQLAELEAIPDAVPVPGLVPGAIMTSLAEHAPVIDEEATEEPPVTETSSSHDSPESAPAPSRVSSKTPAWLESVSEE